VPARAAQKENTLASRARWGRAGGDRGWKRQQGGRGGTLIGAANGLSSLPQPSRVARTSRRTGRHRYRPSSLRQVFWLRTGRQQAVYRGQQAENFICLPPSALRLLSSVRAYLPIGLWGRQWRRKRSLASGPLSSHTAARPRRILTAFPRRHRSRSRRASGRQRAWERYQARAQFQCQIHV